jgi:GTP-binding protein
VIIRKVEYAGTVATPDGPRPGDLPQVAFSGRSNVGKSSLINALILRTRSKLAHVSSHPGKTQALNFYSVNEAFFLVDLPGFGFAKVPLSVREGWRHLIEGYLSNEAALRGVVHLVDARHGPLESDLRMLDYMASLQVPLLVVLTKIDKVKWGERAVVIARTTATLGLDAEQVLPFSSRTGEGRDALLTSLAALLSDGGEDGDPAAEPAPLAESEPTEERL